MQNPMLGAVNQSRLSSQIQPIKNMMNAVRMARNPQLALTQMMQSNPQFRQVSQLIQQAGGDPQKAFYELAQKQGIDPNQIMQMLM